MVAAQGGNHRRLVDNLAAGDVDQRHPRPHRGDRVCVNHVVGRIGVRHRHHHRIRFAQHLVQVANIDDAVEQRVVQPRPRGGARHGDHPHLERLRQLGAAARQIARADNHQRAAGNFLAAIAFPAMRKLFAMQMPQPAKMLQQRHEGKFRQRPRMHPARRGHQNIACRQPQPRRTLPHPGAGGLNPPQLVRHRQFVRRGQIP